MGSRHEWPRKAGVFLVPVRNGWPRWPRWLPAQKRRSQSLAAVSLRRCPSGARKGCLSTARTRWAEVGVKRRPKTCSKLGVPGFEATMGTCFCGGFKENQTEHHHIAFLFFWGGHSQIPLKLLGGGATNTSGAKQTIH